MVTKIMNLHMLFVFTSMTIMLKCFDLWMCKGGVDTFALTINYLSAFWTLIHATINLFEVHETMGLSMIKQQRSLFEKYDLMHNVIAFMKDEGNNLKYMATL